MLVEYWKRKSWRPNLYGHSLLWHCGAAASSFRELELRSHVVGVGSKMSTGVACQLGGVMDSDAQQSSPC